MSKKTIEEQMGSFKKMLWANDKPLEFASAVEEMLMEIQRQQTVMRAGHEQILDHIEVHRQTGAMNPEQLGNLLLSLKSERKGFYPQYLTMIEYREFIGRQTSLEGIAKAMSVAAQIEEEEGSKGG